MKKSEMGFPNPAGLVIRPSVASAHSPIAQLVEHSTVNRIVAGSSPARGAKFTSCLTPIKVVAVQPTIT